MRWFRQEGEPSCEECREMVIDFDNRKILFSGWINHPLGGNGATQIFAFEEVGSEDFKLFLQFGLIGDPGHVFGGDANDDFYRILKMSREEYFAQKLDRKEVLVDYVGDNNIHETKYTAPYKVIYRHETYEICYAGITAENSRNDEAARQ